ncbi:MAG: transcription antitermination factor NusB [Actinomycetes bacterium]|jgi:N utilization substance protein B
MGARHKARKRALDILFEADQRGQSIDAVLTDRAVRGEGIGNAYTETLVTGVVDHHAEIDELIESNAIDWTLDRMPAVDRSLLRLATFELRWGVDIAPAIAIDEAVELAKELSTDESPTFVNGVLGRIAAG